MLWQAVAVVVCASRTQAIAGSLAREEAVISLGTQVHTAASGQDFAQATSRLVYQGCV